MNIIEIIEAAGIIPELKAQTNGGEWKSPCVWCGGRDRFTVWPNHPDSVTGKFICRSCQRAGDGIKLYMDLQHKTYSQACKNFQIPVKISTDPVDLSSRRPQTFEPRSARDVNETWQAKAEMQAFQACKHLLSPAGAKTRQYLMTRGINADAIKNYRLGLISKQLSFDPETWGLDPAVHKKNIWLPEGITIPYFQDGKIIRIRVRQSRDVKTDRYILVAGSAISFMRLQGHGEVSQSIIPAGGLQRPASYALVVESELDAIMMNELAGDIITIFAAGSAQAKPGQTSYQFFTNAKKILVSLDNDMAGNQSAPWWLKQFPRAEIFQCPAGKDPGEAYQAGYDLRAWVLSAVDDAVLVDEVNVGASMVAETSMVDLDCPDPTTKKPVDTKIQQTSVNRSPSPSPSISPEAEPITRCLHNRDCLHLHSVVGKTICMLTPFSERKDNSIFALSKCPAGKWKIYKDSEYLSSVVIMPY
jgi:hypothetical protein